MKKEVSYQEIDLQHWKRKDHFNFFNSFEKPWWGITTQLNCTKAYVYCQTYQVSFFHLYLYLSLRAVNAVRAFRYRIWQGKLLEYEEVGGSITVLRPDETFGFAYFDFYPEFNKFQSVLKDQLHTEKHCRGLKTIPSCQHVIHYSVMPYLSFTQIEHALYGGQEEGIPKISFGKYTMQDHQVLLPMSVHVHHALCDGIDVGKFVTEFQRYLEL